MRTTSETKLTGALMVMWLRVYVIISHNRAKIVPRRVRTSQTFFIVYFRWAGNPQCCARWQTASSNEREIISFDRLYSWRDAATTDLLSNMTLSWPLWVCVAWNSPAGAVRCGALTWWYFWWRRRQ